MSSEPTFLNWVHTGPSEKATVVLIHAVGLDLTYWERQIDALRSNFHVVAFDLPGHGRSRGDAEWWSFDNAVTMTSELIKAVSAQPVHLVGISFGGMIAQSVAIARPELLHSLTLLGTACAFPSEVRRGFRARAKSIREGGMEAVLAASLDRWFTPNTKLSRPDVIDRVTKTLLADDPMVHAAIWDKIADFDVHDRLGEIGCPTLVLVGENDPSTPPTAASVLVDGIRNSRMVVIPQSSHMISVESPDAVNLEMNRFLRGL
ncbi:alpha/beta fold hydrolase [Bradyrhizobium prioriisuperbiae]|uniref:alpha/beta fold hydrolase n=1 Tax=Bradyrhizobium prioriisuperbiae TaxID=2854389 RepID=UPI0028E1C868|nr:alpha/beta fold hydrolase [Bradyrhizobium prioritasuperba]